MARFIRRYDDDQKAALLHSVLVDRRKVTDTVKMARAGELGLPGFEVNLKTAYDIVRKEKATYEAKHPEAMANSIDAMLVKLSAKALEHARGLERKPDVDPDEIVKAARALAAVKRSMGEQAKPAKATAKDRPDDSPSDDGGVLAKLLGNDKGPRGGGPSNGTGAAG